MFEVPLGLTAKASGHKQDLTHFNPIKLTFQCDTFSQLLFSIHTWDKNPCQENQQNTALQYIQEKLPIIISATGRQMA